MMTPRDFLRRLLPGSQVDPGDRLLPLPAELVARIAAVSDGKPADFCRRAILGAVIRAERSR